MSNYFKHKIRCKSPGEIIGWILLAIVAAVAFATLFGFVVMWLWNALMPEIFGLMELNYWQAVGVFILFKILLGGFGCGSGSSSKSKDKCSSDSDSDFSKWEQYDKFWEEEGDQAYTAYLKRKNGDIEQGE